MTTSSATPPELPMKTLVAGVIVVWGSQLFAQTVTIPSGTQPAVVRAAVGAPGTTPNSEAADGNPGGTPAPLTVVLEPGATVQGAGTSPTVALTQAGGQGGTGNDGSGHGGVGGTGGNPGLLTLSLSLGSAVNSTATGGAAVVLAASGGLGGTSGGYTDNLGYPGQPGAGGSDGGTGTIAVHLSGNVSSSAGWAGSVPGTTAVLLNSAGGAGGSIGGTGGGGAQGIGGTTSAPPGGNGGNGGGITLVMDSGASIGSNGSGIVTVSQGGDGSAGIDGSNDVGKGVGGQGGAGGTGGSISFTLGNLPGFRGAVSAAGASTAQAGRPILVPTNDGGLSASTTSYVAAGLLMQSFGGAGADGGLSNGVVATGGSAGAGGSGGTISLLSGNTNLSTTGFSAPAVLAQSIGGSGGDGAGAGGVFSVKGGNGGPGGNGGAMNLTFFDWAGTTSSSQISTSGDDSAGVIAQSIGGGGGFGGGVSVGSAGGAVAIGGNGEQGGSGAAVSIVNGASPQQANTTGGTGIVISTAGDRSTGILAQSIGGGGGAGGNAQSQALGPLSMTIGGSGGAGGDAGTPGTKQVSVTNAGLVQTSGNSAKGIEAQAIGGGGGSGGSANSMTASAQLNITMAIGGVGGTGGTAGDVQVTNGIEFSDSALGQITTMGADSWGILAQSIGGGGGNGGTSKASAVQLANSGEAPSLNITIDVGGKGGTGGDAGNVQVDNFNSIMTGGPGSHGINAQSIGGGGGNGGASDSLQSNVMGSTFNFSLTLGGTGASGGNGGMVTVYNKGLIWTQGAMSYGILAQSIGGSGGNGGVGDSDTASFHATSTSLGSELTLSLGGSGGGGGTGGSVAVYNTDSGGIVTRGDLSRGMFGQSIGGGGGNGGGSAANGSGGDVTVNVALGGSGGAGNDGGPVLVANGGAVFTRGAHAAALFAQSVGGGGGTGGKAATGGGTDPELAIAAYLATSTGISADVQTFAGNVYGWKDATHGDFNVVDKLVSLVTDYDATNTAATAPPDGDGGGSFSVTLDVGAGRSGDGGSGGAGNTVTVSNPGQIATAGPYSPGIFAQSVGGGGGDAGSVAVANNSTNAPSNLTAVIGIGGQGGSGGGGGMVEVSNGGTIQTYGDVSHGISAQSVGGGGGSGGFTLTLGGAVHDIGVSLGGDGGSTGSGGAVTVINTNSGNASIVTTGNDAVGIVAQSVGGGGGVATVMHTVPDPATGGAVSGTGNLLWPTIGNISIGGTQYGNTSCVGRYSVASCGDGGAVSVTSDQISTSGRNAYGILAQSIGGGGGWLVGLALSGNRFFTNSQPMSGSGGPVTVEIRKSLTTLGDGAIGVLAQSIGGGGLLAGDTASGLVAAPQHLPSNSPDFNVGSGGNVTVTVDAGATVTTSGLLAHGIFAQSVGGGGGMVTSDRLVLTGSTYNSPLAGSSAGDIAVNVHGVINANGPGANGVYINSAGLPNATNSTAVYVDGQVFANGSGAAVFVDSNAASNTVTNAGYIVNSTTDGFAVMATGAPVYLHNTLRQHIYGAVNTNGGSFFNEGSWGITGVSHVPSVLSTGALQIGGLFQNQFVSAVLFGNLTSNSVVSTSIDFVNRQAANLTVVGNADIRGEVVIQPTLLAPNAMQFIKTTGTLALSALSVHDTGGIVFGYTPITTATTFAAVPYSKLAAVAAANGFSPSQQALAQHLEAGFVSTVTAAQGSTYATLSALTTVAGYSNALNGLTGEALQAVGTARLASSHAFVERMNSCPGSEGLGDVLVERNCDWARVAGSVTDRHASEHGLGYGLNSQVAQVGAQRRIGGEWTLGGSASYEHSALKADGTGGRVSGDSVSAGTILKREIGHWTVSGAMDVGRGRYESARAIPLGSAVGQATGAFDAWHAGLHSRVAYQMPFDGGYVKPYFDLHAVHMRTQRYAEQGAGMLGLQVGAARDTVLAVSPMLEVGSRIRLGNATELRSFFGLGAISQNQGEWSAQANLLGWAGTPAFRTSSSIPAERMKVNTGVTLSLSSALELRLEYTGEFARDYRSSTGSAKLNYVF